MFSTLNHVHIEYAPSHVLKTKIKMGVPDGCTCVRMGAVGCICTRGQENKWKRGKTQQSGHVFRCGTTHEHEHNVIIS